MKSRLLLPLLLLISTTSWSQDLFISEYLEGSSFDKCIEIYNPTGSPIDLSAYTIEVYFNGNTSSTSIALSGTISACGTYVICHTSATQTSDATSGSLSFNGDDAIALFNGASMIDLFGNIGDDPGSEWTGVGSGTSDGGFVRDPDYCGGVTTDPSGTGPGAFTSFTTTNWIPTADLNGGDLGSNTTNCCTASTNTITPTTVTGGPFSVDCSGPTDDTGTINFTSTGDFNPGNTFTAQFTDGVVLGTVNLDGTDPGGAISITIPSGTQSGTYDIEILASDPYTTSSTTISVNVTQTGSCTPPHLTSVIINSCNAVCQEGSNELVFGSTGDYSLDVTEANFNFSYTNFLSSPVDNFTDNLTNNATTTQTLNDQCPVTDPFIDAYGTTIPANASWVLANDSLCVEDALDWSGLCNSGPIYVIYSSDPTWSQSGNFSNTTDTIRPYQTSMTTTGGQTFTIDYTTDGSQYANSDGVFATFDSDGGPATGYGDDDCQLTPIVLPIELKYFKGVKDGHQNLLYWVTDSERNNSHFLVERSIDGENWEFINTVKGVGTSTTENQYHLYDEKPINAINYYRLTQYDFNGAYKTYLQKVAIDNSIKRGKVVARINSLGQYVTEDYKGLQIVIYEDGSSEKIVE